jgi:hypothetical protein
MLERASSLLNVELAFRFATCMDSRVTCLPEEAVARRPLFPETTKSTEPSYFKDRSRSLQRSIVIITSLTASQFVAIPSIIERSCSLPYFSMVFRCLFRGPCLMSFLSLQSVRNPTWPGARKYLPSVYFLPHRHLLSSIGTRGFNDFSLGAKRTWFFPYCMPTLIWILPYHGTLITLRHLDSTAAYVPSIDCNRDSRQAFQEVKDLQPMEPLRRTP